MLRGDAGQHRTTLVASEAVLPGEHGVAEIAHHDDRLVAIGPTVDDGVADLWWQQVQDAARPDNVLTADHIAQGGHQQIGPGREPLDDQVTTIRECHAFEKGTGLAFVVDD